MGQGEGWLQPYGCQRSAKQYRMPENTATTSCILYKQFSTLLSSVKCNVLRHLNKINTAVELYLEPCEISLVKLPARQNMPAFRFLYHLKLHLGLSKRLLTNSDGEGGCFPKEAGRGSACHWTLLDGLTKPGLGPGETQQKVEFLAGGRSKKQMMRLAANGN